MKFSELIFQVGLRVKVKPDYQGDELHRLGVGEVIGHELVDGRPYRISGQIRDNLIKFENGTIEPFGNWELISHIDA